MGQRDGHSTCAGNIDPDVRYELHRPIRDYSPPKRWVSADLRITLRAVLCVHTLCLRRLAQMLRERGSLAVVGHRIVIV